MASRGSVELCQTVTRGTICLYVPYIDDKFFFLHTFFCQRLTLKFYLKIRNAFKPAILFLTSFLMLLLRSLATKLHDVNYNQCKAQGQDTRVRTSRSRVFLTLTKTLDLLAFFHQVHKKELFLPAKQHVSCAICLCSELLFSISVLRLRARSLRGRAVKLPAL